MSHVPPPPPPPPPKPPVFPVVDVWQNPSQYEIRYVVGSTTWAWIMDRVKTPLMRVEPQGAAALPSAQIAAASASPAAPRQGRRQRTTRSKLQVPATLRMEVIDPVSKRVVVAWHGTSSAFDGLEDKDALVRTIQRCRVEELQLSPPSVLITWDVSLEECRNVVGSKLPTVSSSDVEQPFAVLKEPMGSQGKGIYFVRNVDEIHSIIDEHHQRARAEPAVLEALIAAKNRIPSWGTSECFRCILCVRRPHLFFYSALCLSCLSLSLFVLWITRSTAKK